MSVGTKTIREMCDEFDVTPRALRFYEAKELLFPIREGQKRLFTRRDRARLILILRGKRFGISLEEIRQLLDLYERADGPRQQMVRALDVARRRLGELDQQRNEIETSIAELAEQIRWGEEELDRTNALSAA